jgi:hypothetical protein
MHKKEHPFCRNAKHLKPILMHRVYCRDEKGFKAIGWYCPYCEYMIRDEKP